MRHATWQFERGLLRKCIPACVWDTVQSRGLIPFLRAAPPKYPMESATSALSANMSAVAKSWAHSPSASWSDSGRHRQEAPDQYGFGKIL
jgi:hypothetical protein